MNARQRLTAIGLLALIAAGAAGLYLLRPVVSSVASRSVAAQPDNSLSLDPVYLKTALRLAVLAATPSERSVAQNALNAADDELDLQYAYALQLAAIMPIAETPRIRILQERIRKVDKAIETRKVEVNRLKILLQHLHGTRKSALEQQLAVRQAEIDLFHEILADANDALDEAGGSLKGRLAKLKAQHAALSEEHDSFKFPHHTGSKNTGTLLARWKRWEATNHEQFEVHQARQGALANVASLTSRHDTLAKRIAAEEAESQAWEKSELTPQQFATLSAPRQTRLERKPTLTAAASASALLAQRNLPNSLITLIQDISSHQVMLRILNRRIYDMKALGTAYARWGTMIDRTSRGDLRSLLLGCLWIVLLMACAFLLNRLTEHLFASLSLERRQKTTLQAVLHTSVRLVALALILMIIFGKPNSLSTVLGLAGAGLAIALQDFILSFLGWFILMSRHGIHVGDLVEINQNSFSGVLGEVIEITLFRTVLLETGNWNEPGHLTGRQVAFMNSYTVNGYFFNFSTSGQWLWDELEVAIPRDENPYPLVDKIRAIVATATESQTQQAESEWQGVSARYGTRSFSAKPAVNIKPTDTGVIAIIRYITRADDRPAMRYRLSREIIRLLHDGEELIVGTGVIPSTETPAFGRS